MAAGGGGRGGRGGPSGQQQPMVVKPNVSLGPFCLGMPVGAAVALLADQYKEFPEVDLLYSAADPLSLDIVMKLPRNGLQLRFDAASQRLKFVDVLDTRRLALRYGSKDFSSESVVPTFETVYHKFGPSHGRFDPERSVYLLQYRGITLFFPVKPEHVACFEKGGGDLTANVTFPDGSAPIMSGLSVYYRSDLDNAAPPPLLETAPGAQCGSFYMEPVRALSEQGILFVEQGKHVDFGDLAQSVVAEIGPPGDTFFKVQDQMRIHAAGGAPSSARPSSGRAAAGAHFADYFFNYFALGVDILFDGQTHTVKKFILHSNAPGHFDFQRYAKCNFRLQLPRLAAPEPVLGYESPRADEDSAGMARGSAQSEDAAPTSPNGGAPPSPGDIFEPVEPANIWMGSVVEHQPTVVNDTDPFGYQEERLMSVDLGSQLNSASDGGVSPDGRNGSQHASDYFVVTPDTKWHDVEARLGTANCSKPVVFNRAPAANNTNPFGSTVFWNFQNFIFEVMENGQVASVTLYSPEGKPV